MLAADSSDLPSVLEAADSPWAVLALAIIGAYLLLGKYGGEVLRIARDNAERTKDVQKSIVTNHGSENIGKSMDRLTEIVWDIQRKQNQLTAGQVSTNNELAATREETSAVKELVEKYVDEHTELIQFGYEQLNKKKD